MKPAISSLSQKPKHLLLDLDGTLVGHAGLTLSFDFINRALKALKPMGGIKKATSVLMSIQKEFDKGGAKPNDVRVVELFAKAFDLDLDEARKLLREQVLTVFPELKRHFYPLPGARLFVEWASKEFPLTLATNPVWPVEIVEMRIRWAGLEPAQFKHITHIREMTHCKPKPQYYLEVLEKLKLHPEEVILIGNEVKMDLPATVVGIPTFIVGPYKRLTQLKHKGAKAPAWRGTFDDAQSLLTEAIQNDL